MDFTDAGKMIETLTGCDSETACRLAVEFKGDVVAAVDSILKKPEVAGDKYIPSKPKVDTGMSREQEELCKKGRWLQDQVNAVFSVAHSKTRTLPESAPATCQLENLPAAAAESSVQMELPTTHE
jgi:hypothetical protein